MQFRISESRNAIQLGYRGFYILYHLDAKLISVKCDIVYTGTRYSQRDKNKHHLVKIISQPLILIFLIFLIVSLFSFNLHLYFYALQYISILHSSDFQF